jgi:hypothetical protein
MTKRFCNICERELGPYDGWMISASDRRRGKPYNTETLNDVCDECAEAALAVIRNGRTKVAA